MPAVGALGLMALGAMPAVLAPAVFEAHQVLASDASLNDGFGCSVAIDGNVALVGADYDDNANGIDAGAAYMFTRDASSGTWSEAHKLLAPDGTAGDYFGYAVAVSGDVAVVGASRNDNIGGLMAGAAYVFVRDSGSGSWSEVQKLMASDGSRDDWFGYSVAVSGEVIVVGSVRDDTARGIDTGSAYAFVRDASSGVWAEAQKLLASDGAMVDWFGYSVALSGGIAVVGAPREDNSRGGADAGGAYVYARDGSSGAWSQVQKLISSDASSIDWFGCSVAISGEVLVVGSYLDDNSLGADAGAAYVFARSASSGAWSEAQKLLASDGAAGDLFGYAVAVSGGMAVVGAYLNDNELGTDAGAAYLFAPDPNSNAWSPTQKMEAWNGIDGDYFGRAVAVSDGVAVVAAHRHDTEDVQNAGTAYVLSPCNDFASVASVVTGSCTSCTERDAKDCEEATCAAGFAGYSNGTCCYDFASVASVVTGSCTSCTGLGAADCVEATCTAPGGIAYNGGVCCNDLASVASVETGSCTSCTGYGATQCAEATCAAGFAVYSGGACTSCHDFAAVASVVTGSCTLCTGLGAADCVEATCAATGLAYNSGTCCHDFADVASVETGSCTSCTGVDAADCVAATCAAGFDRYSSGLCFDCHTFASVESVATGSCTSCTGPEAADCVAATCSRGFGSYSNGMCAACHDFNSVVSVITDSCTSCTGPEAADCVEATCAAGFTGYSDGMCCPDFAAVASVITDSCTSCTGPEAVDCVAATCAAGFTGYSDGMCCPDFAAVDSVVDRSSGG